MKVAFKIETHACIPSTQDLMRERLEAGERVHGLVLRALEQTAGRGQRRRDWWSGPGGSYQTLAVRDSVPPVLGKPYAAIAVATGLAQTLPEYGIQLGIKWPNDLHYRNKKVGGILCEYVRDHLLAAVGVNVNNEVPPGATALRGLDPEGVSGFVLAGVQQGLKLLNEPALNLPAAFAPYDVLAGREVELTLGHERVRGVAGGLCAEGCLQVVTEKGLRRVCHAHPRSGLEVVG